MKRNRKIACANDRHEKDNVETETFRHVDQHEKSCVNISESRTAEEGREAEDASDEDEEEGTWTRKPRHVDQYSQSCLDLDLRIV
jgi:hypothetical protein